ncbi:Hypothetical predicted protein [Pelobates cultripes]|uniref:Uncharacterized protein n=1 Tax=Pelobates cultripes TaxID=61616 RepID=A0AAD1W6V7_PELCU|nr:Hypothetical predicted protein [Pelobates cultripes]
MVAEGFEWTSVQYRVKLKKLKGQYKKIKDASSRNGNSQSTWRWYNAIDAIYCQRPANQGREGCLDSVSALLESIMEPVAVHFQIQLRASSVMRAFDDDGPSKSFSSASMMDSTPTQPKITPNAPRHQHTGDRRWLQLDVRTVMEEMRAADERQQERMENLSERWVHALRQHSREARHQEAEMEELATFNQSFLCVLLQLVQVLGGSRDPMSPPRQ